RHPPWIWAGLAAKRRLLPTNDRAFLRRLCQFPTPPASARLALANPPESPMPTLRSLFCAAAMLGFIALPAAAQIAPISPQSFATSAGTVKITPIYHAAAMIEAGADRIYIDPAKPANIAGLPPGDLILITDIHGDHLDAADIAALSKPGTQIIAPAAVAQTVTTAKV